MNQALYAHIYNKRKRKKKKTVGEPGSWIRIQRHVPASQPGGWLREFTEIQCWTEETWRIPETLVIRTEDKKEPTEAGWHGREC
jgi:hypothetical protein